MPSMPGFSRPKSRGVAVAAGRRHDGASGLDASTPSSGDAGHDVRHRLHGGRLSCRRSRVKRRIRRIGTTTGGTPLYSFSRMGGPQPIGVMADEAPPEAVVNIDGAISSTTRRWPNMPATSRYPGETDEMFKLRMHAVRHPGAFGRVVAPTRRRCRRRSRWPQGRWAAWVVRRRRGPATAAPCDAAASWVRCWRRGLARHAVADGRPATPARRSDAIPERDARLAPNDPHRAGHDGLEDQPPSAPTRCAIRRRRDGRQAGRVFSRGESAGAPSAQASSSSGARANRRSWRARTARSARASAGNRAPTPRRLPSRASSASCSTSSER